METLAPECVVSEFLAARARQLWGAQVRQHTVGNVVPRQLYHNYAPRMIYVRVQLAVGETKGWINFSHDNCISPYLFVDLTKEPRYWDCALQHGEALWALYVKPAGAIPSQQWVAPVAGSAFENKTRNYLLFQCRQATTVQAQDPFVAAFTDSTQLTVLVR